MAGDVNTVVDFASVGMLAFVGGILLRYGRKVRRFLNRLDAMVEDWHGHPGNPSRGISFQPSIPERMALVEHELRRNGGVDTDQVTGKVIAGSTKDMTAAVLELLQQVAAVQGANAAATLEGTDPQ